MYPDPVGGVAHRRRGARRRRVGAVGPARAGRAGRFDESMRHPLALCTPPPPCWGRNVGL